MHYDAYMNSNKTQCTKREDMTLLVRLFNMELGGFLFISLLCFMLGLFIRQLKPEPGLFLISNWNGANLKLTLIEIMKMFWI